MSLYNKIILFIACISTVMFIFMTIKVIISALFGDMYKWYAKALVIVLDIIFLWGSILGFYEVFIL